VFLKAGPPQRSVICIVMAEKPQIPAHFPYTLVALVEPKAAEHSAGR
jgi:hypothetical protein